MSKTEQNIRTIRLLEAVQGAVPFGLTRGQIDEAVALVRAAATVRQIATVLHPGFADQHLNAQDELIAHAGAVRLAVRDFDQQPL